MSGREHLPVQTGELAIHSEAARHPMVELEYMLCRPYSGSSLPPLSLIAVLC